MIYTALFDASSLGTITLATVGESDVVLNLANLTANDSDSTASHLFWHSPAPGTFAFASVQTGSALGLFRKTSTTPWYSAVEAGLEALMGAWTTPTALEVTWNWTDPHVTVPSYTIAWPVANFTLTFSTAATAAIFGFTTLSNSGAQTYTGTACPTYVYVPTLSAGSEPTCEYEPESIANHVSTDEGQGFGMSRTVSPLWQDWVQQFETKARTFKANAAATHPWTIQHLIEYCRGEWPFSLYRPGFGGPDAYVPAYYLRSEGTAFQPQRHSPGNDAQFWHAFRGEIGGAYTIAS